MTTPRISTYLTAVVAGDYAVVRSSHATARGQAVPLSFDESYYWLWSKHLALGYYEHPALIALAIRAGTRIFGDTEFGVRFVPLTASLVASWAVWRSAAIWLSSERLGASACLLFNATLMVAAETMGATPDALLIAAASLLLWTVAKLDSTQDGRWWLAAVCCGWCSGRPLG